MELFTLFGRFATNAKEVEKELDDVDRKAQHTSGSFGKSFSNVATSAMGFATKLAGWGTAIMGSTGVIYNTQMEELSASFETMLGSADKANAHMQDLKKFASATPFELGDLANASKTLMSFGVNVTDIMPDIKMLGDISQGNKEKFNSLSLVFGQVASQGKLMGGDLLQMINSGFNPLQEISKKTGKSMSELKDEMSQGKITFEMVSDAMKSATSEGGMFSGAMEKQSHTMSGLMSTLKDNLGEIAGQASKPIFDWIKNSIQGILDVLPTVSSDLGSFFDKLQSGESIGQAFKDSFSNLLGEGTAGAIGNVLQTIKDGFGWIIENKDILISGIVGIVGAMATIKTITFITGIIEQFKAWKTATSELTLVQQALNLVMEANPIGAVIALISGLVAGVVTLWNTSEDFRNAVTNGWNAVVAFFTTTIPAWWNGAMAWLQGVWDSLIQWFANLWVSIGQAFTNGWNAVVAFFTTTIPQWIDSMFQWFNQLPGLIGNALGTALGTIVQWGVNAWNYLVTNVPQWIQGIGNFFAQLPGVIANWINNAYNNIVQWGSNVWNKAMEIGRTFIQNIVNFFQQLPGQISNLLSNAFNSVSNWANQMWNKASETASTFGRNLWNGLMQIPGQMLQVGENIVHGIWNGISNAFGWIKNMIGGFVGGVVNGFKHALGINSPSKLMQDEIGTFMAQGISVGFTSELDNVKNDMGQSLVNTSTTGLMESVTQNVGSGSIGVGATQDAIASAQPIVINIDGREVFRAMNPYMAMSGVRTR